MEWCTMAEYVTLYPADSKPLTPAAFDRYAEAASDAILCRTFGRAANITDDSVAGFATLRRCQAAVIHAMIDCDRVAKSSHGGLVASATVDGYSESYASASDQSVIISDAVDSAIVRVLRSDPDTEALTSRGVW